MTWATTIPKCGNNCFTRRKKRPNIGSLVYLRLGVSLRLVLVERNAADHRSVAEFFPQAIDRMFGRSAVPAAHIDEIGPIGILRASERTDANADQAKSGSSGLAGQQLAGGCEYPHRQLG